MAGRLRLRRRLFLYSAPVLLLAVLVSVKLISVVIAGDAARSDFARHDLPALESDVAVLQIVDVIEPGVTALAAGDLDVLAGRLPEAEQRFVEALARTDPGASCPVRINLLLVRETLGDLAARGDDRADAQRRYRDAIAIAEQAPADCFAGNNDPAEERRAVRADALPRLQGKLAALDGPPPNLPALPPPPAPPPPPPPPAVATPEQPEPPEEPEEDDGRRLGTEGEPGDRLRILLDDSNAYGDSRE